MISLCLTVDFDSNKLEMKLTCDPNKLVGCRLVARFQGRV